MSKSIFLDYNIYIDNNILIIDLIIIILFQFFKPQIIKYFKVVNTFCDKVYYRSAVPKMCALYGLRANKLYLKRLPRLR